MCGCQYFRVRVIAFQQISGPEGLEILQKRFQDFPGGVGTLKSTTGELTALVDVRHACLEA